MIDCAVGLGWITLYGLVAAALKPLKADPGREEPEIQQAKMSLEVGVTATAQDSSGGRLRCFEEREKGFARSLSWNENAGVESKGCGVAEDGGIDLMQKSAVGGIRFHVQLHVETLPHPQVPND